MLLSFPLVPGRGGGGGDPVVTPQGWLRTSQPEIMVQGFSRWPVFTEARFHYQYMWNLRRSKGHWDRACFGCFSFPLRISFHPFSMLIN
jgi:hypothetical protein